MTLLLRCWIRLWFGCWVALALWPAPSRAGDEPLRVVFVGNSYTYTNDLPMLFRALVHSQNPTRDVQTEAFVTPGGYLNERWRDGVVQRYLKANRVDVLVLQEAGGWLRCADSSTLRSTFACTDSLRTHKRYAEFAAKLGVRAVIFGTWGADVREQSSISRVTRPSSMVATMLHASGQSRLQRVFAVTGGSLTREDAIAAGSVHTGRARSASIAGRSKSNDGDRKSTRLNSSH